MKLVLGTAQLGEDYGIAFPGKKITKSAFTTLLNIAKNNNIFNIDTAVAYGDSLTILGEISVDEMLVIWWQSRFRKKMHSASAFSDQTSKEIQP